MLIRFFFGLVVFAHCCLGGVFDGPVKDIRQPFKPGNICNYQPSIGGHFAKYLCVPKAACRNNTKRRPPALPYDACSSYLFKPNHENQQYECCHPKDITEDQYRFVREEFYLPGVRASFMCANHSHYNCNGSISYCYKDLVNYGGRVQGGSRTTVTKYPFLARVGYPDESNPKDPYHWFCQASIVAPRFLLSAASCSAYKNIVATVVQVGINRYYNISQNRMHVGQVIDIDSFIRFPKYEQYQYYHDIAVIRLKRDITFNRFTRPACINTDQHPLDEQTTFVGYGLNKKKTVHIKIPAQELIPVFYPIPDGEYIYFKVKGSSNLHVTLSNSEAWEARFYRFLEVKFGENKNSETWIHPDNSYQGYIYETPGVLSNTTFRSFFIRHTVDGLIEVGRDNEIMSPFGSARPDNPFDVTHVGFSNHGYKPGEWSLIYYNPAAEDNSASNIIDVLTPARESNPIYLPLPPSDFFSFYVRAKTEIVIRLAQFPDDRGVSPQYIDVVIGADNNTKSYLKLQHGGQIEELSTPDILSNQFMRKFWVKYNRNNVGWFEFGRDNVYTLPLFEHYAKSWRDYAVPIYCYGVFTPGDGGAEWSLPTTGSLLNPIEIEMDVSHRNQCLPYYVYAEQSGILDSVDTIYQDIQFCAWQNGTSERPCNGDYGGATVVMKESPYCMWHITGILGPTPGQNSVSCTEEKPGLYTRVNIYYMNWLEYTLFGDSFDLLSVNVAPTQCYWVSGPKQPGQC